MSDLEALLFGYIQGHNIDEFKRILPSMRYVLKFCPFEYLPQSFNNIRLSEANFRSTGHFRGQKNLDHIFLTPYSS